MADLLNRSEAGVVRQANVVLRTAGGEMVALRMPGLAASGDDAEQLGLASPAYTDVPFGPVAFHRASTETRLLVSADAVLGQVKTLAYDSADLLFEAAFGIVADGVLYAITDSHAAQAAGTPYCYWLTLRAPAR